MAAASEAVFPPSKFIREELAARNLTQTDLALITGRSPQEISLFLTREKISREFAKELSVVLGNSPEYWKVLEARYHLSLAPEPNADVFKKNLIIQGSPIKEMQKRGWLTKTDDFEITRKEVEKFFAEGIDDNGVERTAFFKKTFKLDELNSAEKAWICRARQLAKMLPDSQYDETRLPELFAKLKKVAKSSQAVHKIAQLLQLYGIRFVIIQPLPTAKIDGAAFWLDEYSPVIALSLRFDNIGSFWFALTHEVIHIKHRDGTSIDNFEHEAVSEVEKRANREAADFLVSQSRLDAFIKQNKPYFSQYKIVELANDLRIHPGIIVGQLQFRKEVGYNTHHASMAKVRELVTTTAFTDGWSHPVPVVKYEEIL